MSNAELINAAIASAIEAMHSHNPVQNLQAIQGLNTNDPTTKIRAIHETHAKLQMIEVRLDLITADCARDSINKLEIAMLKLYKVAIFIRGDYDGRDEDKEQRDSCFRPPSKRSKTSRTAARLASQRSRNFTRRSARPPPLSRLPYGSASARTLDG